MIANQTLQETIDLLYQTFEKYPLLKVVEGCPCCVKSEDNERIHSKLLRELTGNDLERYCFKAMTTWGDEDDFRHFLPRIFELLIHTNGLGIVNPEIVLGKLTYGHWHTWPQDEQIAIQKYFGAVWQIVLSDSESAPEMNSDLRDIDTCLCAIGQAEDDLMPYLEYWLHKTTLAVCEQLEQFVSDNGQTIVSKKNLNNPFWKGRDKQIFQVIDWLKDGKTIQYLENQFFDNVDAPYANPLASAIDSLKWIIKAQN